MNRLELGRTGIEVSDWCLGTMTFGTQTPEADAFAQMDMALEAGIDFFDTAEMYPVNPVRPETVGTCEELIGRWFAAGGKRDRVVLATKAGGDSQMIRDGEGYGPDNIETLIDASLRRLGTDYIDLYQLHWPMRGSYMFRQNWTYDPSGQDRQRTVDHMAGVLEALGRAQKAGKIRAFGMSNESAWGCTRWIDVAEQVGGPRLASVQNEYSLLCRLYDTDMAEMAVNEDVTLLSFSPLAAGLLTGKYQGDVVPVGSRREAGSRDLGGRMTDRVLPAVQAYLDVAAKYGLDPVHVAMAWQRTRPFPISAIFGATTKAQLSHLLAGDTVKLSDEVLTDIDAAHRSHPMPY
ncbi:aldo/keto reductase [Salibaculum griseiflavum]|uniref:Aldo/keto reductase n=1 Tax=Salibaculum griseiflavum TaxID=1914409 RepID=A0A2V1P2X0_9RHOB|nr:aldo/keto reductase [Salibaculum griseiflavum]PWG15662.1 aldo/keto reductase [Salibaculum griseiflavum]